MIDLLIELIDRYHHQCTTYFSSLKDSRRCVWGWPEAGLTSQSSEVSLSVLFYVHRLFFLRCAKMCKL